MLKRKVGTFVEDDGNLFNIVNINFLWYDVSFTVLFYISDPVEKINVTKFLNYYKQLFPNQEAFIGICYIFSYK